MRVIDCTCGETLKAGNDDDLVEAVKDHVRDRHPDMGMSDEDARHLVEDQAYEATDA
jgi:predicted small metal-binding protein